MTADPMNPIARIPAIATAILLTCSALLGAACVPQTCPDGILLTLEADPDDEDPWDPAPGKARKPDMRGYIILNGQKERLKLRPDRYRVTAPFFKGKETKLTGKLKLHINDKDVDSDDVMASSEVDVTDVLGSGREVDSLWVSLECR